MEGAGKLIEDEELREAMSEKGLGTPATRARDHRRSDLRRATSIAKARSCMPTAKAFSLMTLLRGLGVPELFSPELTASGSSSSRRWSTASLQRDAFMREIVAMTEHIVGQAEELRERHDPRRLRAR